MESVNLKTLERILAQEERTRLAATCPLYGSRLRTVCPRYWYFYELRLHLPFPGFCRGMLLISSLFLSSPHPTHLLMLSLLWEMSPVMARVSTGRMLKLIYDALYDLHLEVNFVLKCTVCRTCFPGDVSILMTWEEQHFPPQAVCHDTCQALSPPLGHLHIALAGNPSKRSLLPGPPF